jgi:signal transduction histidine kinase
MLTQDNPVSPLESSAQLLSPDSTLQALSLHLFYAEVTCPGVEIARRFDLNPLLPGVVLLQDGTFFGMISRRRFLEQLSRPFGLDLFSKRPIGALYKFIETRHLILSGNTRIVEAAQRSLERSPDLLYEPIVVYVAPDTYQLLDIHQLLIAQSKIHQLTTELLHQQTQAQLIQTEKMASLGQMVSGVAHEILNPVNFIWGNLDYLFQYGEDLIRLLNTYDADFAQPSPAIQALKQDIEYEFILEDFPQVLASMRLGTERLRKIIHALRSFSHMDEGKPIPADIHECLDNTLLILHNRIKHRVEVVKNYGELPSINCYSGQLSQVFMNLIGNAIDALTDEASQSSMAGRRPEIQINTGVCSSPDAKGDDARWIAIRITDNGPGIPPEMQERVFDMFFTTKPAGKGTGLGLAISHQIIVEKHNGQLTLQSQPGIGTEFQVLLPVC